MPVYGQLKLLEFHKFWYLIIIIIILLIIIIIIIINTITS